MSETDSNLSRRKFMAVSSAAIAAPIFLNMAGKVPVAGAAEKTYDFVDNKSCDLIVLGGGGSGMVASVRAAQLTGRKVVILEKDSATGGAAQFAGTIRTFGSKWQADRKLPDTTTEFARDMMDLVYWRLDEKLVLNCLLGTGQFFDWLCEQGVGIGDLFVIGKYSGPGGEIESGPLCPQMDDKKSGKRFGRFLMDMMKEKCETSGVEVLTKHPVVDIDVKNGRIVAAVAKSEKGYVRIACRACVMSVGSWINNEEILKKCCPKFVGMKQYMNPSVHLSPIYTGDGIPLAEKAGAFVDYDSFCMRLMGPAYDYGSTSKVFLAMMQSPYIITVNLNGKRFSSEPTGHLGRLGHGQVQIDQPHGQSFDIFDENTLAATFNLPKSTRTPEDINAPSLKPSEEFYLPDTMEEVYSSIKEGFAKADRNIFKADTLEELADRIGANKKNLLETVRKYNESCEKGVDLDFFKRKDALVPINKPPYYAFLGKLMTDGAFGGVQVNPEMQAYRPDGGLVEGLYVTGDFTSSRFINLGGVKHQVINDLSWALSSGFLAGTNAGRYLQSLG
jgi:fumarate reductase flavoprotein subunit